uniref:Uncharacterized protein n=1 Tax=Leishmania guyanensis TaxID=5670 RepID=A0A1E1J3Y2_LEIGU|nr:hypothetical protein, unknown function [Leishmania guyanensis]
MSTSSLASPTTEKAQKLKEAQLKIGMALKNAQYALTTHAHRGLTTALHENASALTALSTYLSLSGSPVKAAAIAGQMAKILKSVGTYVSAKERNSGTSQHTEVSRLSSSFSTPPSSSVVLDDLGLLPETPHESAGLVAELQRVVRELTRERDAMADEKRALEAALEESRQHSTVTPHTAFEAHSPDTADKDPDVVIRQLHAEVKGLKHEVREEHMKAAALQDQLHEAEEQIEDQQDQVQALKMQLRLSQEEKLSQDAAFAKKEEEIKALQEAFLQNSRNTAAPSSAAAAAATRSPHGYVDKDDFDALKLQNQLLQQALREQTTQMRPTDPHAVLSQQTLEEIEADHHQQLEAMKLTIQEQYNRENQLLDKQRSMQDTIDDLKRQLQLSSNRQWVQQEREKHLNEMDSAERHMEHLQETVERHEQHIHLQQTKLQHYAENERSTSDVIKNLEQHHDTQIAKLNQQIIELRDELNKACRREQKLHDQVQASNTETQATIAATTEQYNHHQQHISSLTHSMAAEREQHESRVAELQQAHAAQVAELQQRLEVERDHAAANQSTAAECESALQQRLSELRTSMAAEREQHESRVAELQQAHAAQVAELQQRLEVERDHAAANQSTAAECESALQQRLSELRTSMAAEREQHESRVAELQQAHAAQVAELQQGRKLNVLRDESAEKFWVTSQPVDWLKEENESLKMQVREWEEKHTEVTNEKVSAVVKVGEVEEMLSCCKCELQRLKAEYSSLQKTMSKSLEDRDIAVKRLKESVHLTEEAEANVVRLETLRKELQEVQERLEITDKDRALVVSRYRRATTEKEECADAARRLLTEYKEMAATREKLVAQLAAAEALAAERSREVEELTRAAPAGANLKSSGPRDDALEAVGQKVVQSTVSEKQERIEALVCELEAVTRENKRLRSELEVAQVRQAAPQRASLTAEPTSMQSAFAQDMLSSLAGMRVTLNTMHTQLVPILEQIRVEERSRAAAAVDPSASTSAVDALEKLYTSMESVHAVTQATLEDFDIGARQLRVSAELQAVVYGKLLATLQQHRGKGATSPLTSTLVDVSLVRACTALFGELSTGSTPKWEENERHGEQQLISHTDQRYCPGRASSATRDYVVAAEKNRRVAVSATAHQQSPSTWSHYHAFSSAPSVFASSVGVDNRGRYSRTVNHARRRADDRELFILDNAGYGRQPARAGSWYQSSFENFAMAQASISVAEERARLRTAPTPPWR